MNRARLWPLATLILGLATLGVFLALGRQPDVRAVYGAGDVAAAVSAFQRAETLGDLTAVFGAPPDLRAIAALDAVNRLDLWAFIPAYVLFLTAAAIMLAQARNGPLLWAAIGFALIGGAADAVETAKQLRVTADWDHAAAYLPIAPWYWLKYAALALNGFAVAGLCLLGEPRRSLLGAVALAPLPCVLAAWAGLAETRVFSVAFAVYWIALIVVAAGTAMRPGMAQGSPT
ncbi:MAG: hypothetical protein ACREH4_01925 [Vitreimonas sp.]